MSLPRPPAGIARVSFEGHHDTSNWANVFWLQTTGFDLADGTDVGTLATDLYGAFETRFLGLTSVDNVLAQVKVVLYQTSGELMATSSSSHSGSVARPGLTGGVAIVCSWGTTAFWRGGKPRTYFSGLSSSDVNNATSFKTSTVSAWLAGAAGFITDVDGMATTHLDTVTLGFLSRVHAGAPRTPGIFFPYLNAFVRTNPASQRRRNEYTGI